MIVKKLDPLSFEKKWQKIWEEEGIYQPDLAGAGKPFYNLMMFPYPSAEGLHVGNMYAFTGVDIFGRFMRMKGYDVFEPIGLDGFGIHSENYALKIGKHPAEQAKVSEKNFYRQLKSIGNGFAWKNRLETYDPDYYRWTQWLFVQMFKNGLAYKKKSPVNFCPSCKTVLSDEQVIDGMCERCKSEVVKKQMEQWFFRITRYAGKLLQNTFKQSFKWSDKVKIGQRNWIGKKEGININYPIIAGPVSQESQTTVDEIICFTTRPDTNFGATFVVIAPEHPFAERLLSDNSLKLPKLLKSHIFDYVATSRKKTSQERIAEGREKTGVFTGFYCVNQLTGYKMPLYISDFVLMEFGTGAVVGVPGHDKRDFEFAKKFNLPVVRVVIGSDNDNSKIEKIGQVQEDEGKMVNSGFLDGLDIHKATEKMMDFLTEKGWGKRVTTYRLRDWCISRQRYWGAPIPMIYCQKCASEEKSWFSAEEAEQNKIRNTKHETRNKFKKQNSNDQNNFGFRISDFGFPDRMAGWFPVPEKDLPVLLPDLSDWKPEGTGKGPLAKVQSFVTAKCPHCGGEAQRETDVCDTFLDSSWYFLRYPSIKIQKSKFKSQNFNSKLKSEKNEITNNLPWDKEITKKWLPVSMYIGGAEHTVLHLLYSRFITMAMHDFGFLDFEEPYRQFYAHGVIIAEGAKMSKSKGNIIGPDTYINKYGADALRTYLMFLGPFDMGGDFRDTGILGMHKFLKRVWKLVGDFIAKSDKTTSGVAGCSKAKAMTLPTVKESEKLTRFMHRAIKEVTEDLEKLRYNTAIAHIMEYVNEISNFEFRISNLPKEVFQNLLLVLAPFAPHMTEELWFRLQQGVKTTSGAAGCSGAKAMTLPMVKKPENTSIHLHPWPSFDPKYLVEDEVVIAVQVNGKLRETVKISNLKSQISKEAEKEAYKSEKVQKYLAGKTIRKVIFVPGKILNFVV